MASSRRCHVRLSPLWWRQGSALPRGDCNGLHVHRCQASQKISRGKTFPVHLPVYLPGGLDDAEGLQEPGQLLVTHPASFHFRLQQCRSLVFPWRESCRGLAVFRVHLFIHPHSSSCAHPSEVGDILGPIRSYATYPCPFESYTTYLSIIDFSTDSLMTTRSWVPFLMKSSKC